MGFKSAVKHTPVPLSEWKKYQDKQLALSKKNTELQKALSTQAGRGPGFVATPRNKYEVEADVTAPGFEGFRDRKTGKLLSDFVLDPFKGEASSRIRSEALGTGPSELTKLQLQRQLAEEAKMRGDVGLRSQAATSEAMSNLARTGGIGGGARTSLARSAARDKLMAAQGVASQGVMSRFGINEADMKRRQELLGQVADTERQADLTNMGTLKEDIGRRGEFDSNRYNQQMQAWGAEKTAEATRASGGGGGGCFDPQTMISMANGTEKPISEIVCGDDLLAGGIVLSTHLFEGEFELFSYGGALLTGDHAVFENTKWVRVQDSKKAKETGIFVKEVRNLVTKNHIIISNDCVFSDNEETDANYADERLSLAALNGEI
jgi:hypothetical protein